MIENLYICNELNVNCPPPPVSHASIPGPKMEVLFWKNLEPFGYRTYLAE